jgi:hypothetical protein
MVGAVINLLLLGLLFTTSILCVVLPLGALGIMFWHWHRELGEMARLRHPRSTQVGQDHQTSIEQSF